MATNKRVLPKLKTQTEWKREFDFLIFTSQHMTCKVCTKFNDKIVSSKNYNPNFIKGCTNFRKSAVSDHAKSEMHAKALEYLEKEKAETLGQKFVKKTGSAAGTAIADSLKNMGQMSSAQREGIEKLFHIAYYLGSKGRPYSDFADLIDLEKLHDVSFVRSRSYENETACREFISFCSQSIFEKNVKDKVNRSNFISILCDGSTDSGVVEKECIYVLFVDPDTFKPNVTFFSLKDVPSQDAEGIHRAIKAAFKDAGLEHLLKKVVFLGSDGASVNTGVKNGLITLVRQDTPWVGFVWCLAHRLELALKDALKEWMDPISLCLQNLYYLYEKSSKKLRELRDFHLTLREVYEFENNQVKPHRACGTRWISHKLLALGNMLDKYGLYMQHFENIIADTSKKTDKATLEGKRRQLQKAETVILGALMYDLLEPARELSLKTQEKQTDLINIADLMSSTRQRYERLLNKVNTKPEVIFEFPMLKNILSKVKGSNFFGSSSEQGDDTTFKYQDIVLKYYNQAKTKAINVAPKILQQICDSFQQRFGALEDDELVNETATQSDVILNHICKAMNTKTWLVPESGVSSDTFKGSIDSLLVIFNQFKQMPIFETITFHELEEQYLQLIEYASKYYDVKQFNASDFWPMLRQINEHDRFKDIFLLSELCFCAPYSNATVERFFNYMKVVKSDWRSRLGEKNLEALLRIKVEGPTLRDFEKEHCKRAVNLWWDAKQRRVQQGKRKIYAKREHGKEHKRLKFSNEFIDSFLETSDSEDENIDFQAPE